jgi:hypothetical protein
VARFIAVFHFLVLAMHLAIYGPCGNIHERKNLSPQMLSDSFRGRRDISYDRRKFCPANGWSGVSEATMIIIVYGSILPPFPNNWAAIVG